MKGLPIDPRSSCYDKAGLQRLISWLCVCVCVCGIDGWIDGWLSVHPPSALLQTNHCDCKRGNSSVLQSPLMKYLTCDCVSTDFVSADPRPLLGLASSPRYPMPRVLPGGTLLHRHARQAPVELLPQWSTVIQLSARHLSCPSHASGTGNVVATRTGAGVLGGLPARSTHTLAATVTGKSCLSRSHRSPRTLDCLTRSLSNTTLSTNASIPALYLSGLERQHRDRTKESSTKSLGSANVSLPGRLMVNKIGHYCSTFRI